MKDDYNTNSHYLTYTFLFRKVGRMYFSSPFICLLLSCSWLTSSSSLALVSFSSLSLFIYLSWSSSKATSFLSSCSCNFSRKRGGRRSISWWVRKRTARDICYLTGEQPVDVSAECGSTCDRYRGPPTYRPTFDRYSTDPSGWVGQRCPPDPDDKKTGPASSQSERVLCHDSRPQTDIMSW